MFSFWIKYFYLALCDLLFFSAVPLVELLYLSALLHAVSRRTASRISFWIAACCLGPPFLALEALYLLMIQAGDILWGGDLPTAYLYIMACIPIVAIAACFGLALRIVGNATVRTASLAALIIGIFQYYVPAYLGWGLANIWFVVYGW